MKLCKILFFVDGFAPTSQDMLEASEMKANVMFRNAQVVPAEGSLEQCDGVAGCVPPSYAAKFPKADEAIEKMQKEIKKAAEKMGDVKPPKKPAKLEPTPEPTPEPEKKSEQNSSWKPNA